MKQRNATVNTWQSHKYLNTVGACLLLKIEALRNSQRTFVKVKSPVNDQYRLYMLRHELFKKLQAPSSGSWC